MATLVPAPAAALPEILLPTWYLDCSSYQAMLGIVGYARAKGVPISEYLWWAAGKCLHAANSELHAGKTPTCEQVAIDYDQFRAMCDAYAAR